jgi:tetratricopeptide (TPR) repeat protein
MPDIPLDEASDYLGHIVDGRQNIVATGFQVAPGLVITALHALSPIILQDQHNGVQVIPFGGDRACPAVIQAADGDLDVALLFCEEPFTRSVGGFVPSDTVEPGTRCQLMVAASAGQLARVDAQWGGTRISAGTWEGQLSTDDLVAVRAGMSGSPVMDRGGQLVVGMLLGVARGSATSSAGMLRAVRGEDLARFLDNLEGEAPLAQPDLPHLLYEMSVLAQRTGDRQATDVLERAADPNRSAGDPRSAVVALHSLGQIAVSEGNAETAERWYLQALTLAEEVGDFFGSGDTCYSLALLAYQRNDNGHAVRYLDQAVARFERVGRRDGQAASHTLLGQVAEEGERYYDARSHYEQALRLYESARHPTGLASSYLRLGSVTFRQGEYYHSDRYLQQALDLFERAGDQDAVAATLANLGIVAASTGQSDQAVLYLVRALAVTDPQRRQFDGVIRQLGNVRAQVGDEQFGGLMLSAVAASGHDEEWLLERLRSANPEPEAGDADAGAPEAPGDPPEIPPGPPPAGPGESGPDDDDPQIINIWIGERAGNPTVPLSARQRYTLVFRVGLPHPGNIAEGPREIPRSAIPSEGLPTKWVVSSTDVALSPDPAGASGIRVSMADSGGAAQWMAAFEITVPVRGDSAERRLAIVPLSEGQARIEVAVSIADDLYRWLKIDLVVSPPSTAPSPAPPAPAPGSEPGSWPQRTITTTVVHGPPLRQVAPEPAADWQVPATRLNITLQPPQAHLDCERLGFDAMVSWAPNCGLIEGQIQRVRAALDRLRLAQQGYFNGIDPDEFGARLAAFQPSPDWAAPTGPSHPWTQIAACLQLRELAQEGHVLYQAVFPAGSEMRTAVDALQPGDMLSLTWFPSVQHVAHVPWALMYREPPPPIGQPIDAENFLGIRLRLRYVSHQMPYLNRSLGDQDSFTRAHLMYWGSGTGDPVATERERHVQELQQWKPYTLPTGAPGKPQVVQFLDNPAPNPVRLVYIYCRSMAADQDGPGFRFGNGPRDEDTVALSEMGVATIPDRPLVFANACGTSAGSLFAPNELEERFFLRGCSAFIGTECKVPITFAARFATAFFHFLYANSEEPTPAGEALTQARRFFWSEYGILGGLFYSYVNDYHLYVATDAAVAALSKLRRVS